MNVPDMNNFRTYLLAVFRNVKRLGRKIRIQIYSFGKGIDPCPACGLRAKLIHTSVLWPELINEWGLSPIWADWFDKREGSKCEYCCSSLRDRQLAETIINAINTKEGTNFSSLNKLCVAPIARKLMIAEINSVGNLHQFLRDMPELYYSEFGSEFPEVPSEDLTSLSYVDSTFDLVLTSETLEHVPDVELALKEIYRVLKPGGMHIFTVPVVWDKSLTRRRASIQEGQLVHHLSPSYHGSPQGEKPDFLVFYEFGADFVEQCQKVGFTVDLVRDNENPSLVTFVTQRTR